MYGFKNSKIDKGSIINFKTTALFFTVIQHRIVIMSSILLNFLQNTYVKFYENIKNNVKRKEKTINIMC